LPKKATVFAIELASTFVSDLECGAGNGSKNFTRAQVFGLNWERTFDSTTINTVRIGYNHLFFATNGITAFGPNIQANLGFANAPATPALYGLPSIGVTQNYPNLGNGNNGTQLEIIYEINRRFTQRWNRSLGQAAASQTRNRPRRRLKKRLGEWDASSDHYAPWSLGSISVIAMLSQLRESQCF